MEDERVVEIIRTFTSKRTQVIISDITWSTTTADNPDNPQAEYKLHVMAHVSGISARQPQEAIHTPHTHLTLGWFRGLNKQMQKKTTMLLGIKETLPITLEAELQLRHETPRSTRSRKEDHWCLPLHIHRNEDRGYDPLQQRTELAAWIDSTYDKIADGIKFHNRTYAYMGMVGGKTRTFHSDTSPSTN